MSVEKIEVFPHLLEHTEDILVDARFLLASMRGKCIVAAGRIEETKERRDSQESEAEKAAPGQKILHLKSSLRLKSKIREYLCGTWGNSSEYPGKP